MTGRAIPRRPAPEPARRARTKQDWIANQLRRVYDEALQEDIPADMIDLLDQARRGDPRQEDGS